MRTELRLTDDGSCTLYVPEIDECYHSVHGAVQESRHIFIADGLRAFARACRQADAGEEISSESSCDDEYSKLRRIKVLEIGFGTGLNAYLTLLEAERLKIPIHYTAIELYPLPAVEALKLNYPEILSANQGLFEKIHLLPWGSSQSISTYFTLCKVKVDFMHYELQGLYDVIYFDAFSPEKQPEMWTENRFGMIYEHAENNAILTTYCAKGAVRRAMQSAGFVAERLPGPPGKREILRGRKSI